jgi:hypothetical protein
MAASYSKCPEDSSKTGIEVDHTYDYLSRLDAYAAYSGGTKTDSADYTYDALDRLVKESETRSGATPRTTTFTHLGLADLITKEVQKNTSTGATITTPSYSHDAYGNRISMTDDPAGTTAASTFTATTSPARRELTIVEREIPHGYLNCGLLLPVKSVANARPTVLQAGPDVGVPHGTGPASPRTPSGPERLAEAAQLRPRG